MRIAVGCDHAGFPMKATLANEIKAAGHKSEMSARSTKRRPIIRISRASW